MLNDHLDWPGIAQVYRLERKFSWVRQGLIYKTSCEVEYGITSLSRIQASPARVMNIKYQASTLVYRDRTALSSECHLPRRYNPHDHC